MPNVVGVLDAVVAGRPTRASPSSGCSRRGGRCRRSCARRRAPRAGPAGRPGRRPSSRRSRRRGRRGRRAAGRSLGTVRLRLVGDGGRLVRPMVANGRPRTALATPRRRAYTRPRGRPLVAAALVGSGYLIGSLPMGVIVARLTGGTDPRTVGSGRTGGTNALRAMGLAARSWWASLDVAKGAVPILVARAVGRRRVRPGARGRRRRAGCLEVGLPAASTEAAAWPRASAACCGRQPARSCSSRRRSSSVIIVVTRYVSLGSLLGTALRGRSWRSCSSSPAALDAGWLLYVAAGPGHRLARAPRQHPAPAGRHASGTIDWRRRRGRDATSPPVRPPRLTAADRRLSCAGAGPRPARGRCRRRGSRR